MFNGHPDVYIKFTVTRDFSDNVIAVRVAAYAHTILGISTFSFFILSPVGRARFGIPTRIRWVSSGSRWVFFTTLGDICCSSPHINTYLGGRRHGASVVDFARGQGARSLFRFVRDLIPSVAVLDPSSVQLWPTYHPTHPRPLIPSTSSLLLKVQIHGRIPYRPSHPLPNPSQKYLLRNLSLQHHPQLPLTIQFFHPLHPRFGSTPRY